MRMSWHRDEAGPEALVRNGTAARAAMEPRTGIARESLVMARPPWTRDRQADYGPGARMLRGSFYPGRAARSPQESERLPVGTERLDHEGDVVLQVDPEEARPLRDLEALDLRGEGPVLELLEDALRPEGRDPPRPHQAAGSDEPRQLVAGEE